MYTHVEDHTQFVYLKF